MNTFEHGGQIDEFVKDIKSVIAFENINIAIKR